MLRWVTHETHSFTKVFNHEWISKFLLRNYSWTHDRKKEYIIHRTGDFHLVCHLLSVYDVWLWHTVVMGTHLQLCCMWQHCQFSTILRSRSASPFFFFFFFWTTSPYNNAQYKVMNGLTDYGLFHTVHESSAHLIKCLLLTGYRSHRLHERALFLDRAVVSIMQHCHFKSTTSVILLLWLCCWITFTPLDK